MYFYFIKLNSLSIYVFFSHQAELFVSLCIFFSSSWTLCRLMIFCYPRRTLYQFMDFFQTSRTSVVSWDHFYYSVCFYLIIFSEYTDKTTNFTCTSTDRFKRNYMSCTIKKRGDFNTFHQGIYAVQVGNAGISYDRYHVYGLYLDAYKIYSRGMNE